MKIPYLNYALLITNLCILFFILTGQKKSDNATTDVVPVLRAQLIELVDDKGQVRAQLKVEKDGEAMFRMKDPQGVIRVKMGAGADGSGLVLLDNSTNVGIHALAKSKGSFLTVTNKNGKTQTIQP